MLKFIVILVFVCIFFRILYGFYVDYKNDNNQLIQRIREDLIHLSPVAENIVIYEGDQSYTYNKLKIYLCLYDENGKQYPYDSIMYVAIHELAHVLCEETGHTPKFWEINDALLKKATEKGIYHGASISRNYCPLY